MLFEAAAVDDTMRATGREKALSLPANQKYLAGWGRKGDVGRIAVEAEGVPLGAAWYRLFPAESPGYGLVSATIPELTISVHSNARGRHRRRSHSGPLERRSRAGMVGPQPLS
ncbi:hypothetical protein [Ktedonobacter sp. SOSP1-52]|uniref:hypothetical protein n=1 Tax=Ktedonobacter sp. SOSP1-52 TaxID=2778366 RepID=UPI00191620D0|nr:hypothetical protein [Ktedonobacter sp. SOSP1-52]